MSARFGARRRLVDRVVADVAAWAARQPDVRAAVVVGSYAYGRPRMSSDVDLVLLADDPQAHLRSLDVVAAACPRGRVVRRAQWGPLHECRVRLSGGLLVEFGFCPPAWAALPLDAGTARVLGDGCRVLVDRDVIAPALESLGRPVTIWTPSA